MTDGITHASNTFFFSTSVWLKHLILCFIQLLKVILVMNIHGVTTTLAFYNGKFFLFILVTTVTRGVVLKPHFASLKRVRSS